LEEVKTYQLEPITGDKRQECLNKIIIRKEVFDDEYHWPTLCRVLDANKHLFKNEYFMKSQTIKEFAGRTIPFKLLDSQNEIRFTFKSYMNICRFLGQHLIHEYTKELHFPDNTELTRWETGREMTAHSDNSWPDGDKTNHPTSFRTWSGIYYINDIYEGGEIYFPRLDWSYRPVANTLLLFPSNDDFIHGVTKVTKGERYTFAMWYTQDFQYLEI
jgi:hypothetical protein